MNDNLTAEGSALVLFSGGQDSTVCLAWALHRFRHVETVGFSYGQRHEVELRARETVRAEIKRRFPAWGQSLGEDHMIDLPSLGQISDTALTRDAAIEMTESGLPSTFVPGRNLLFFTYAAALGYRRNIFTLVGGMCETDFSGYPDCRDKTLRALGDVITQGMDKKFVIETPLMFVDKAATWAMAFNLGGDALCDIVNEHTHTCYLGERSLRHEWGYGCGQCPACVLRKKGYEKWQAEMTTSKS